MNRKNIPSIVFFVVAVLLAIYAIWAYAYCADIISQARAAGQLAAKGNEYDIASFYMGNSGQYLVLALLLAAAGLILQRKQPAQNRPAASGNGLGNKANDEELDEWFEESKG